MTQAIRATATLALLTLAPIVVQAQVPFLDELTLDLQALSAYPKKCYLLTARKIRRRNSNGYSFYELATQFVFGCYTLWVEDESQLVKAELQGYRAMELLPDCRDCDPQNPRDSGASLLTAGN